MIQDLVDRRIDEPHELDLGYGPKALRREADAHAGDQGLRERRVDYALLAEAQSLRGEVTGRIRLGTVGDPELTRLPDVLRRAVACYPLLAIDVRQEVSGAAFAKVRDGDLDAAFYYGGLTHPAVAAMPLAQLTFRIVVPAAWAERLAGADWDAIAAEPWIMTPSISTHHALATELFAAHGIAPVRQVQADHEAVISSLVAAGVGVALLREEMAADAADGDIAIWGDTRLTASLSFICRRARELEPAIAALRDVVRDVFFSPGGSIAAVRHGPPGTTVDDGRSNPPAIDSGETA